ncbi:N-acetyltransferase [Jeotgalibacillus proteolyticus]|uniref:N-acetyltransferase n=1 Tax=Jeotgalibacillus proteolyticus TaxID=2082395 RepID=A0A2S5GDN3_9BACL|nr:N-acetyltransferase [Jeotgalibacillus proteolyticus]PPA71106.1 N-acetyltransferase [Jeotgalibacillus proteolyticus]
MIRKAKGTDVDVIVDIWYRGSIQAHDFIDPAYWSSQIVQMKEKYIPMAETYVMTSEEKIIGFISVVDHYIAALFIDAGHQNKGTGKKLVDFVKEQKDILQLKVYKENLSGLRFYEKNGFEVKTELFDEPTGEKEYFMEWSRKKA